MGKKIKMKLLTIVTITKDDLIGLRSTLTSLIKIKKEEWVENIVIDGSNDQYVQDTKNLSLKIKNTFYSQQKDTGISNAFNAGIGMAKGNWIWFLNSGDTLLPNFSSVFLENYLTETSADIIVFEYLHGEKLIHRPPFYSLWPPYYNWVPHPATLIKKTVFSRYGLFNSSYRIGMDWELWMRLLVKPDLRVDLISLPISKFDQGGISSTNISLKSKESISILLKYLPIIIRRNLNQLYLFLRSLVQNILGSL